ncbi:hypothetical protein BJX68DRAFT_229393 [Aspergillus pseudodeflectus]|uniref:Aminoglycoside phosphotransferase domain-containing protein n=1 Tax=Aspergillus pseudodeflectus TaxID=176178 RepID=A0ABR4KZR2_9EURO
MEFDPTLDAEVRDLITQQNRSWPLVFTHGDLSSLDILARGDKIVGMIDWETAGWYPSYWEYTSAHQVNPQNSFCVDEIDKFLQPMPEQLKMEQTRQKYFGDISAALSWHLGLYDNLSQLHQIKRWNLSHIKIGLPIESVLDFFPLAVSHGWVAHLRPVGNIRPCASGSALSVPKAS